MLDEIEKGMSYKDASFLYNISERMLDRRMGERRDQVYMTNKKDAINCVFFISFYYADIVCIFLTSYF